MRCGTVWCSRVRPVLDGISLQHFEISFISCNSCISWLKMVSAFCLCHLCAKNAAFKTECQKVPKRATWPLTSRKRPRKICLSTVKKRSSFGCSINHLHQLPLRRPSIQPRVSLSSPHGSEKTRPKQQIATNQDMVCGCGLKSLFPVWSVVPWTERASAPLCGAG